MKSGPTSSEDRINSRILGEADGKLVQTRRLNVTRQPTYWNPMLHPASAMETIAARLRIVKLDGLGCIYW